MNDKDHLQLWLMGLFLVIGVTILAMIYYNANHIVEAAYKTSNLIVKVMEK